MRLVTLGFTLAIVSPVLAQSAPDTAPPPPPAKTQDQVPAREEFTLPVQPRGRYSFAPVDEGFLRFDHKAGEVALCRPQASSWTCDPVPDRSAARQSEPNENDKEISALRDEVAGLKKEITALRAPPPPPPHPVPPQTVPPSPEDETGSITLKQDIARARGFIADTWRRLVDMIDNLQKDMRKRGDSDTSRT